MKITQLMIDHVKRIEAVSITPDGNLIVIGGDNGAGKSSILDGIEMLFGGKKHVCKQPVNSGADEAYVIADIGEYVVRRRFKASGATDIEISSKEGHIMTSPQKWLDSLCGDLAFDPAAFVNMEPKEQKAALMRLLRLDFSELDSEREKVYQERTYIGREVTALENQGRGIQPDPGCPKEEVSVTKLMEDLNAAHLVNSENASKRTAADMATVSVKAVQQKIAELEELLANAKAELETEQTREAEAKKAAENLQDIDVSAIETRIAEADEVNARVRRQAERRQLGIKYKAKKEEYDAKTARITEIDQLKEQAIADAQFPVDGLGFGPDGVMFNGVPFDQASSAEQLRVAVAMGIAANPELRIVLIRDGSLLDNKSLAAIEDMAEKHDLQVWMERVGDGKECSIIIEDGSVKEDRTKQ